MSAIALKDKGHACHKWETASYSSVIRANLHVHLHCFDDDDANSLSGNFSNLCTSL